VVGEPHVGVAAVLTGQYVSHAAEFDRRPVTVQFRRAALPVQQPPEPAVLDDAEVLSCRPESDRTGHVNAVEDGGARLFERLLGRVELCAGVPLGRLIERLDALMDGGQLLVLLVTSAIT
jgi:hypothetical protein